MAKLLKSVLIIGGGVSYSTMWESMGYRVTDNLQDAAIINFTGGEDVSPELYGETPHPRTHFNTFRDQRETALYKAARAMDKMLVGICRGGQFLNVMNGGRMWQDVNGHTKNHIARDLLSGRDYWVTSTHHQMMRPHEDGHILMIADESTIKHSMKDGIWDQRIDEPSPDVEAVWYPKTKSLCFQPHPEFFASDDCLRAFKMYVGRYYASTFNTMKGDQ